MNKFFLVVLAVLCASAMAFRMRVRQEDVEYKQMLVDECDGDEECLEILKGWVCEGDD
jgi:hypothetical protein